MAVERVDGIEREGLENGKKRFRAEGCFRGEELPRGGEGAVVVIGGDIDQVHRGVEQVGVAKGGAGAEEREQLRMHGLTRGQWFSLKFGGKGEDQFAVGVGGEVTAQEFAHGGLSGLGEELTND